MWYWHLCKYVWPQCPASSCCRQRSTTWTWFACASRFSCRTRMASTAERSTPSSPTPSTTTVSGWALLASHCACADTVLGNYKWWDHYEIARWLYLQEHKPSDVRCVHLRVHCSSRADDDILLIKAANIFAWSKKSFPTSWNKVKVAILCKNWEVTQVAVFTHPVQFQYVAVAVQSVYASVCCKTCRLYECRVDVLSKLFVVSVALVKQVQCSSHKLRKRKFFIHTNPQTTLLPWCTSSSESRHVTCDSTWWSLSYKLNVVLFLPEANME